MSSVVESPVGQQGQGVWVPRGEASLDPALVDQAVAELNRIYVVKTVETAQLIGRCVLDTFFGGDVEAFRTGSSRHVSFRKLAERDDLYMSHSFLYSAVAVVDQLRVLPDEVREALPFTHQKLLLAVRDEDDKVELARQAATQGLSSRELAAEVRKRKASRQEGPKRGRPNLPAFAKAFRKVKKVAAEAASEEIGEATFERFDRKQAEQVLVEVEEGIRALEAVAERVRGVLGEGG